jgi:hypothetical protein
MEMAPVEKEEFQQVLRTVERIEDTLDELDDVVRGDVGRRMPGLLEDMKTVHTFIMKWERRELMIRGAFLLLSSNIILTILAIAAQIFLS